MEQARIYLMHAEASLRWAAEGEFSAHVTPPQARALRAELERLRTSRHEVVERLREIAHEWGMSGRDNAADALDCALSQIVPPSDSAPKPPPPPGYEA